MVIRLQKSNIFGLRNSLKTKDLKSKCVYYLSGKYFNYQITFKNGYAVVTGKEL